MDMEAKKEYIKVIERLQYALTKSNFPAINFKAKQVQCFEALLKKKDVVGVFPTGYGKSVLFQLLPDFLKCQCYEEDTGSTVIVVTPLNSIIDDQMQALQSYKISCAALKDEVITFNSPSMFNHEKKEEKKENRDDETCYEEDSGDGVFMDNISIVFCHPEAILSDSGKKNLRNSKLKKNVKAIVVDEAHCVELWGKEFRKDFRELAAIRSFFPSVPWMALTATAPSSMIKRVSQSLQMKNPLILTINPNRQNIYLDKQKKLDTCYGTMAYDKILLPIAKELLNKLTDYPQTIIYSKKLEYCGYGYSLFARVLRDKQYINSIELPENSLFVQYHAPQTERMKKEILTEITKDHSNIRVIFATSALGMGVNAPNVAKIIHLHPPSTMEQYMQEVGRAGRSGNPATAVLYFCKSEISHHKIELGKISTHVKRYCENNDCLRAQMLSYFGFTAKQSICCCNCNPERAYKVPDDTNVKIKFRKISKDFCFDELVASYDCNNENLDVAVKMFQDERSTEEFANKLMSINENVEYIKDKRSLVIYAVNDEDMENAIFDLVEKFTTIL